MRNSDNDYRWLKYKNGKSYFAIVNLDIEKSEIKNEIIENYSGMGYSNHSIDVGSEGMESWKKGLIAGLEFALSFSSDFWKIVINKVEGKPMTDTNPTIIGYTGILAFLEATEIVIDKQLLQQLEEFVYDSWKENSDERKPNFSIRIFE
ncbi:hypothetical protein [Flavobacterium hydatis]|uniref:Uncharacterized protein n=1 Tax=Flavobacterium hydatis TaxID=991 RepID=A0A086ALJ1_FLAHY|nr:hypothetical protein [Flavobacterium hydatis]KFF17555.1 hypothetical protein IW20_07605 [Flavobacterium hydatis]OXA94639.1 hypothetical protein B0A62_10670 [Flavobacterium hydatis]